MENDNGIVLNDEGMVIKKNTGERRRLLAEMLRKQSNAIQQECCLIPLIPTDEDYRYHIRVNGNTYMIYFWNAYDDQVGIRVPTSISGVPSDYLIEIDVTPNTPDIVELVRRDTVFCIDISKIKKQFKAEHIEKMQKNIDGRATVSNKEIIVLNDDEGNAVEFDFLDLIPYRGKEYVVLLPVSDEADEVVILQLEEADDETESYISVDNELTLQTVFEIFKERTKDIFDFID